MKKTILIYDDDADILLLCKTILAKYDYHVETLSRCDNILSDIATINPDLVIMDLWIPEMGGEKAIQHLKQNDAGCKVPILLFSANANVKEICNKINVNGYIEKPFSINTFLETIEKNIR